MQLGSYVLEEPVAAGSTAVVYRARHVELGSLAAVKVLHAALRSRPELIERFRAEARTLATLDHPGIARVFDQGQTGEQLWIALEWVEGAPLDEVLAVRGRLRPEQAVLVVRDALRGLAFAHDRAVVHGDVAASNVLLSDAGRSMLVDFGLACPVGSTGVCGTPAFMSPEAATGGVLTKASDVYSAGALLYLLLSGGPALAAPDLAGTLLRHQREAPPRLAAAGDLADVLATATALEPTDRYPDAAALLDALEQAAERRFGVGWWTGASLVGLATGVTAMAAAGGGAAAAGTAVEALGSIDTGAVPPASAPAPAPAVHRVARRIPKKALVVAVSVAVVAVAGTAVAVATSGSSTSAKPAATRVLPTAGLPGLPSAAASSGGGSVSVGGDINDTYALQRLTCVDGQQVQTATATFTAKGAPQTVPLVYLGGSTWFADLRPFGLAANQPPDDFESTGSCGAASPATGSVPADLYLANLDFTSPENLDGSGRSVRVVAKGTGLETGCDFGGTPVDVIWIHGYAPVDQVDGLRNLQEIPGLIHTPMPPAGDGTFVVTLTDAAYQAMISRTVEGKTYTEGARGRCDFSSLPAPTPPGGTHS
jgi:hypothetical protein